MKFFFGVIYLLALPAITFATPHHSPTFKVCFTPGQNCTEQLIMVLAQAKRSIWVQAYSFTSAPIAKALVAAKNRGLDVRVILDKSQRRQKYSAATFLYHHGIPTWIDDKPAIAHNKVMIIDKRIVVTGSFNFTKAAQYRNAENLLIIHDFGLAKLYQQNWQQRVQVSQIYLQPTKNLS